MSGHVAQEEVSIFRLRADFTAEFPDDLFTRLVSRVAVLSEPVVQGLGLLVFRVMIDEAWVISLSL
jgi:hypothetical protein